MLFVYLKKLGCAVLNWGLSSCPEWFKMHTSLCPLLHVILISLCQCVFLVCLFKGITMQQSFMETSLGALVNLALKKTLLSSVVLHEVSEFSVCVASIKKLTFSLSHRALILPSVFAPSQTNCSFHTYDALDDKPDASSHAQPAWPQMLIASDRPTV